MDNTSSQNIIFDILDLTHYPKNKEEFFDLFIQLSVKKTLEDLIETLPEGKKSEVKEKFDNAQTSKDISDIVEQNFTQENYARTMQQATVAVLNDYIASTLPSLTEQQKQDLDNYLSSLNKTEYNQA